MSAFLAIHLTFTFFYYSFLKAKIRLFFHGKLTNHRLEKEEKEE